MNYLLDTDSFSYLTKKNSPYRIPLLQKLKEYEPSQIHISEMTQCELYYGLEHLPPENASHKEALSHAIHALLSTLTILPLGRGTPLLYGQIRAGLVARGQDIGVMDTLLAAQAIAYKMTLVTHNLKHYSRIPTLLNREDLKLADWTLIQ